MKLKIEFINKDKYYFLNDNLYNIIIYDNKAYRLKEYLINILKKGKNHKKYNIAIKKLNRAVKRNIYIYIK